MYFLNSNTTNEIKNKVAWIRLSNGKYSVKSGYQYWQTNHNGMNPVNVGKGWSRLWKLNIPHKTHILLLRFSKNNILVRNLLRGRGVPNPIICLMCEHDIEHVLHLFFDCEFARSCWQV